MIRIPAVCRLSALVAWLGAMVFLLMAAVSSVQAAPAERAGTDWQVAEIYLATLGYAPDAEGLDFWVENIQTRPEWTPTTVAQSFFDQPLVQEKYPEAGGYGPLIDALYQNLFERMPDAAGYSYWLAELEAGRVQRNQMIIALINGGWANPDAADDMARFGNRVRVSLEFVRYQQAHDIHYSELSASDQAYLRQAGRDVLAGVGAGAEDHLKGISQVPVLLSRLRVADDEGRAAYIPGEPAPLSTSPLTVSRQVPAGRGSELRLADGSMARMPAIDAEYEAIWSRNTNAVPVAEVFQGTSGIEATGSMRTLSLRGTGDASQLKPRVQFPASETGSLNPETVAVLREGPVWVGDELVDNHRVVLPAEIMPDGAVEFVDPMIPDSLFEVFVTPGEEEDGLAEGPVVLSEVDARNSGETHYGTWVGQVRYSLITFEHSVNWSQSPQLLRMLPDAERADQGYRRPATQSELAELAKQPICNVHILVHGHNEQEKRGFEPATEAWPWKVHYKRLVWELMYKTFLEGEAYPADCTAFYEFIYPSYRPIFSPVTEKTRTRHETLGEAFGRLVTREWENNPRLRSMREHDMPLNVTITAHSMGGLVSRAGLRHVPDEFLDQLQRLTTWGTPHEGAALYSLAYALKVGHDLNWLGYRIPMHNIGQSDAYASALDGLAIDTPAKRDMRLNSELAPRTALGEVLSENMVTGFERSEVELPYGSHFFSDNLKTFNETEGLWAGNRLDDKYMFFHGTTSKMADVQTGSTWQFWLGATMRFNLGSTPIEQGAYLNTIALQAPYAANDGAVPVFSQRGTTLLRPSGIRTYDLGDTDHEEFYGAEPAQRNEDSIAKGERVARWTYLHAGYTDPTHACPLVEAKLNRDTGGVEIAGELVYPRYDEAHGGDGQLARRIRDVEIRRGDAAGPVLGGFVPDNADYPDGRFTLRADAELVDDVRDSLFVVVIMRDGSEVVSSPLTGLEGGVAGERVNFSQDYRFAEGSSGDWPEQLSVRLAGDLRINISYRGEPIRRVRVEPPRLVLENRNQSVAVASEVVEIKVPWMGGGDYDVAVNGTVSIRPSAESGSYEADGRTINWGLDQPSDPLRRYRQTSCEQFANAEQFDIKADGSASVAFTVRDLVSACDLVLEYPVAPYDDSSIDAFGNYWRLRTVLSQIVLRISGYN